MSALLHPSEVLFGANRPLPSIPAVDHYCGSEKLMRKALALQNELGPLFDITLDCEDGAPAGREREHAELVASLLLSADNAYGRVGARIHDITHEHWRDDLDLIVGQAGARLAFLTLPKARGAADVEAVIAALRAAEARAGLSSEIPLHVLIETHGALHQVWQIAALPGVESLDFGLMDFVSEHHGAIPDAAMRSPGQFEHPLIARAKCEIASAALAHAVIPAHNVTTEIGDGSAAYADALLARERFGFLRMWSIHPVQIEPILSAMRPGAEDVDDAAQILLAAQAAHWGPIRHDGRLHDRASYRYYWQLLCRARQTGVALPAAAEQNFFASL